MSCTVTVFLVIWGLGILPLAGSLLLFTEPSGWGRLVKVWTVAILWPLVVLLILAVAVVVWIWEKLFP